MLFSCKVLEEDLPVVELEIDRLTINSTGVWIDVYWKQTDEFRWLNDTYAGSIKQPFADYELTEPLEYRELMSVPDCETVSNEYVDEDMISFRIDSSLDPSENAGISMKIDTETWIYLGEYNVFSGGQRTVAKARFVTPEVEITFLESEE